MVQYGYEDAKTGRIERLELSTDAYDAKKEALRRYKAGEKVYVWHYSVGNGSWGKPAEWHPENDHKGGGLPKKSNKSETKKVKRSKGRGIRELSEPEIAEMERALFTGMPVSMIAKHMDINEKAISRYKFNHKIKIMPKTNLVEKGEELRRGRRSSQENPQGIAETAAQISEKAAELETLRTEINELIIELQKMVMGDVC
jgi:hypothetical protein